MPLFFLDGVAMWILLLGNSVSSIPIFFETVELVPKNIQGHMCLLGVFEVKAVTSFWFMTAGWCVYILSLLINFICLVSRKQKSDDAVYAYMDKIPCSVVSQQLQTVFQFSFCWLLKCCGVKAHSFMAYCWIGHLCGCSCAMCLGEVKFPQYIGKG